MKKVIITSIVLIVTVGLIVSQHIGCKLRQCHHDLAIDGFGAGIPILMVNDQWYMIDHQYPFQSAELKVLNSYFRYRRLKLTNYFFNFLRIGSNLIILQIRLSKTVSMWLRLLYL